MFRPLNDRIIVSPDNPEERSKGGIIIPESAKSPAYTGRVVAVGPGRQRDGELRRPLDFAVGERIVFNVRGARRVKIEGENYLMFDEEEVLGVVEE